MQIGTYGALSRGEVESRVAEYVRFQNVYLLHPLAHIIAFGEHSEKVG